MKETIKLRIYFLFVNFRLAGFTRFFCYLSTPSRGRIAVIVVHGATAVSCSVVTWRCGKAQPCLLRSLLLSVLLRGPEDVDREVLYLNR
jgi:hypothetical protein